MNKAVLRRGMCTAFVLAGYMVPFRGVVRAQAGQSASGAPMPETAQSPAAEAGDSAALPTFEVVSIKPHKDEGMMMRNGVRYGPDGFVADGFPLQMFLLQAFGLSADRILNEPDWVKSARFDMQAKVAPEDVPKLKPLSMQQRFAMMLPVLEDRFGLKFHHETKELQVYTLVVAKGGPKLKVSPPAESSGDAPPPPPAPPRGMGGPGAPEGGAGAMGPQGAAGPRTFMHMSTQGMTVDAHGATMASLANIIAQQMGGTVVDKTGLTGKYDFTLAFMPDNFMINGQSVNPPGGGTPDGAQEQEPVGPSIFTAVQEQLGLKLDTKKEPVDVVVIDQIEQPTEN